MSSRSHHGSRKPEMVQVRGTEYVFGENGGRGTTASTFFRHHSGRKSEPAIGRLSGEEKYKVVGAAYSFRDVLRRSQTSKPDLEIVNSSSSSLHSIPRGHHKDDEDSDDDWSASIDDSVASKVKAIEYNPNQRNVDSNPYKHLDSKGMRRDVEGETLSRVSLNSLNPVPSNTSESEGNVDIEEINAQLSRINKFKSLLGAANINLPALKKLAWSGIPDEFRPRAWKILMGYLPTNSERRKNALLKKRKEYLDGVKQVFSTEIDHQVWHQISIDVPRTNPHIKLYSFEATQKALEKILYLWAIRHPASGYVQGINDLCTPFLQVFLSEYVQDEDIEDFDPGQLKKEQLDSVEADTYWCLTKLLDGIQDNYIHAQPGIQRQVLALQELTQRIDAGLVRHFKAEHVEFIQFSFRWMNCMLMREVSVKSIIRMWDTYMAEGTSGFSDFHLYVCAAFLVRWSSQLQTMDFQEIMMFLQALPTNNWGEKEIELLLSEAYMWQSLFKNATAHFR